MAMLNAETSMICVLGVAGIKGSIELYGVNSSRKVTVHGWFSQGMGLSVLIARPTCLIAVDAGALPAESIAELQSSGHRVVVMPVTGTADSGPVGKVQDHGPNHRRSAKDVCYLAIRLSEITTPPATRDIQ